MDEDGRSTIIDRGSIIETTAHERSAWWDSVEAPPVEETWYAQVVDLRAVSEVYFHRQLLKCHF